MVRRNTGQASLAFCAYLAFVVYGSLLPFEVRDLSFNAALEQFHHIRFLELGVVSRADWVANILLYIPLAFLGCAWVADRVSKNLLRALAVSFVVVVCLGVAVAVEFTQLFFAPRTVSLNDLLAEAIGTALGVLIWVFARARIRALWWAFHTGGRASILAAITLYALLYFFLSLFPYDFFISTAELQAKLSSGGLGWILAGACTSTSRCIMSLLIEMLAIAPIGLLLALVSSRISLRKLFLVGLVLGLVLESFQLLLASGITQGLSVFLRGIGLVAGAGLGNVIQRAGPDRLAKIVWRLSLVGTPFYLVAVAWANRWFSSGWLSPGVGATRLAEVELMPFYYHYYTTETVALSSLLAQAAMYTPVGVAVWSKFASLPYRRRGRFLLAAFIAATIALPIEMGKAFIPGTHPDFTNLIIAAVSAVISCWLAGWLFSCITGVEPAQEVDEESPDIVVPGTVPERPPPKPLGLVVSATAVLAILSGLFVYPIGTPILVLTLAAYGLWLCYRPGLWLFVLAALLPVLDLSPITGRLLLDEFDLFVLVTLLIGYWRTYSMSAQAWPNRLFGVSYFMLWATWITAVAWGLWPLNFLPDPLAVSSHSPLEAWQAGKGLLWALLLVPLARRVPAAQAETAGKLFLSGLVTGLGLLCVIVLWERHVFVGVTDFENVFRVTGSFSNMHTGGAYIEAYIAFAFPILVVWLLSQSRGWGRLAGIVLVCLAAYAMLVTFSRGGYAGLAAGLVVVGLAVWRWHGVGFLRRVLVIAAVLLGVSMVAVPVLTGEFAQSRLARAGEDMQIRQAHWRQAVQLMDDGVLTALGGMGFGRYPTQYLYNADLDRTPGNYSLLHEGDMSFLRLGAGDSVYLDQRVAVEPDKKYQLSGRIRQPSGKATLKIPICEKALLTSFDCQWFQFEPTNDSVETGWQTISMQVESGSIGSGGNWPHRPVKLSLYNPGTDNPIDIAVVSLKSSDGHELLANGSFDEGITRWLFVTDRGPAWHIDQQEIETYFAQGLLGLFALVLLLVAVGQCLWPALKAGNPFASAISGALIAFLTVGLLGSTTDTARLAMLFYFGVLAGGLLLPPGRNH